MIPLLLLAALVQGRDSVCPCSGRAGTIAVPAVRSEAPVVIDGRLDEDVWRQAPVLTGFSTYLPVDEQVAEDSTQVLVWYSPTAVHFGVRAFEIHGEVNATLADRDKLDTEDHVQILIDSYFDRKKAYVFAVNALGVQGDGVRMEEMGRNPPQAGLRSVDLSPDFLFESKGRRTEWGYEVELRIPFKSIRFASGKRQDWGLQVLRQVQHSGFLTSWTRTGRFAPSFFAFEGRLAGLHDLERGVVLDLNPVFTNMATGSATSSGWRYEQRPQASGNVRWGVTPSVTLNATVKPDFSQVEADATRIEQDVRFAVFYQERRPFFTDGIELFEMQERLIYTRRIVQPSAAAKLTGKIGRSDIALIGARDDPAQSSTGRDTPMFGILRTRRDIGQSGWLGVTMTNRAEGRSYNRVAALDARMIFAKLYQLNAVAVASSTRGGDTTFAGPMWSASLNRTGRLFGLRYAVSGVSPSFETKTGFIPRRDFAKVDIIHRVTIPGRPGGFLRSANTRVFVSLASPYSEFLHGSTPLEQSARITNDTYFRGGWSIMLQPGIDRFAFDAARYADYRVVRPRSDGTVDTVAFAVAPRTNAFSLGFGITSPQWTHVQVGVMGATGHDPEFRETGSAARTQLGFTLDYRPTTQIRFSPTLTFDRWVRSDGSLLQRSIIPRVKLEYQLTKAIFLRYVGQYDARFADALRDRLLGDPLIVQHDTGFEASAASSEYALRNDWLFSYQPRPGTVVFAGYGASLQEPEQFRFRRLARTSDGFFVKLSYLFRL